MLVIDDKGDGWHKFPHIFVDFDSRTGPVTGTYEYLQIGERSPSLKDYKRVKKFPDSFPEPTTGTVHDEKGITLNDPDFSMLKHGNDMFHTLYEIDGKYNFLKPKDIILVANQDHESGSTKHYLRITHVESLKLKDYLKKNPDAQWMIERQIGKLPEEGKTLNAYEFKKTYDFVVEREKAKNK